MNFTIDIPFDVRNRIHLLGETGTDTTELLARYETLAAEIEPGARAESPEWQAFEHEVAAMAVTWPDDEPSALDEVLALRPEQPVAAPCSLSREQLHGRVLGGWLGRIAGCTLGKPVECLMREKDSRRALRELLSTAGEYPLTDYITAEAVGPYWKRISADGGAKWFSGMAGSLRGRITCGPSDDDLNYTVAGLRIVRDRGRLFTPDDVLATWTRCLPFGAVCTAEKMAYRNYVMGLRYPETASCANEYCEWIGAQIRADLYGYISPGRPVEAARMAFNDAAASHLANGIYGAMWVAAAIAAAFTCDDPVEIVEQGLAQVPRSSRLAEHLRATLAAAQANGSDYEATFDDIERRLGDYHCVHTVNNACVVAAALVHGGHDLGKVITIAVMGGLDTDCNGATAGSIAGVMLGRGALPERWVGVFNDTLRSSVNGYQCTPVAQLAAETVELVEWPGDA